MSRSRMNKVIDRWRGSSGSGVSKLGQREEVTFSCQVSVRVEEE